MLNPTHSFAGFTYPRPFPHLPTGKASERLAVRRAVNASRIANGLAPRATVRAHAGGYFITGGPVSAEHDMAYFYLNDYGMPAPRYARAHEVREFRPKHSGWYLDEHCDETVSGLVVYLPGGRLLAGWTLGVGMASALDRRTVYDCPREAAWAADQMAERYAENEREYRATLSDESEMLD